VGVGGGWGRTSVIRTITNARVARLDTLKAADNNLLQFIRRVRETSKCLKCQKANGLHGDKLPDTPIRPQSIPSEDVCVCVCVWRKSVDVFGNCC